MYYIGEFITLVFKVAFLVGITLILIYVLFNMLYNSRFFRKLPQNLKQFIYAIINFTRIWGPRSLIVYIMGQIIFSLANLLGI